MKEDRRAVSPFSSVACSYKSKHTQIYTHTENERSVREARNEEDEGRTDERKRQVKEGNHDNTCLKFAGACWRGKRQLLTFKRLLGAPDSMVLSEKENESKKNEKVRRSERQDRFFLNFWTLFQTLPAN